MSNIQRAAATSPRTPLSASALANEFTSALGSDAKQALKLFMTSNTAITEKIAASGGHIAAFVKNGQMFVLAVPYKGAAALYSLDNTGKAQPAYDAALSKLAALYNEKSDADTGYLMANLRNALSRINNVPSSRLPGSPATEQERRISEAVRDAEALGSSRASSFVGDVLEVEENSGKGREELARRMEDEIKAVSDRKRKELPLAISKLEDELSSNYDYVSIDFGGL